MKDTIIIYKPDLPYNDGGEESSEVILCEECGEDNTQCLCAAREKVSNQIKIENGNN